MELPVPVAPADNTPTLTDALRSAAEYAQSEKADATRRAYLSDFRDFHTWCEAVQASALPVSIETTAAYLAQLADKGLKASTISRRAAAIGYVHRAKGFKPPTNAEPVKAVLRGIRRRLGAAVNRKDPATASAIARMVRRIPDNLQGKRDKALLLLGFAAALRRSELVALDLADLERMPEGIIVHIRRSKTDQEGEGHQVAVPRGSKLKPVEALEDWLRSALVETGPVFRSIRKGESVNPDRLSEGSVADIVKRYAKAAGLDPETFSGHSLRARFVTSALEAGADLLKVMDITRHREVKTLKAYDRRAKAFKNHAGKGFL
jgi:site-specific recombinase XerD